MKCISLWQPFATLIAVGAKRFETRSWSTSHRGPIAIHAAKKWNDDLARMCWQLPFYEALEQHVDFEPTIKLPRGAIVAVADITDVGIAQSVEAGIIERQFGDFSPGRFAWKMENVRAIEPLPYRGRQGLFDIDLSIDDISARVIR